jgi:hypothetical protein
MLQAWERWKCIQYFDWKPEGNIPLGRPRCWWEDNIITDLWEMGWEGADWMVLAEDRDQWRALVNIVTDLWVL